MWVPNHPLLSLSSFLIEPKAKRLFLTAREGIPTQIDCETDSVEQEHSVNINASYETRESSIPWLEKSFFSVNLYKFKWIFMAYLVPLLALWWLVLNNK